MKVLVVSDVFDDFLAGDRNLNENAKKILDLIRNNGVQAYITEETLDSVRKKAESCLTPSEVESFIQAVRHRVPLFDITDQVRQRSNHYCFEHGVSPEAAIAIACSIQNRFDAIIATTSNKYYEFWLQKIESKSENFNLVVLSSKDDLIAFISQVISSTPTELPPNNGQGRHISVSKNLKLILIFIFSLILIVFLNFLFQQLNISSRVNFNPPTSPKPEFQPPIQVIPGTTINIGGSITMIPINRDFKKKFEDKFPGTIVEVEKWNSGTNDGIKNLCDGILDIASASTSLKNMTKKPCDGLKEVFVIPDAISIIVRYDNNLSNLTKKEVKDIFQCKISTLNELRKEHSSYILVTNRSKKSGTRDEFKNLFLDNEEFCPQDSPNYAHFKTEKDDLITKHFKNFKKNEISYASYYFAETQTLVKSVAIDGLNPDDPNYPYRRNTYYIYKDSHEMPVKQKVKDFLGFVIVTLTKK